MRKVKLLPSQDCEAGYAPDVFLIKLKNFPPDDNISLKPGSHFFAGMLTHRKLSHLKEHTMSAL